MLNFYKTINNRIEEIPTMEEGCWVSAIAPTEEEISLLVNSLSIDPDFVRAALDEEEASRVDTDDENNTYKNIGNKVVLDTKLCLLSI